MMLSSMTGYGSGRASGLAGRFTVHIQSINRKGLEVAVSLPAHLSPYEVAVRRCVEEGLLRGRVTLTIEVDYQGASPETLRPNIALAQDLVTGWREIAKAFQWEEPSQEVLYDLLARHPAVFVSTSRWKEQEGVVQETLMAAVQGALQELKKMRYEEGSVLVADLHERLTGIEGHLGSIIKKAEGLPLQYRAKIAARLQEWASLLPDQEERCLREVALYAERMDIAEEVTRFRCHLEQFHRVLTGEKVGGGKLLDFLVLELLREINTIGSKVADIEVSTLVIEIKCQLDRIREQVQNLE